MPRHVPPVQDAGVRLDVRRSDVLDVGGEALVQPQVRPPEPREWIGVKELLTGENN